MGACVTGICSFELTGFGLSLEQPTVTEQRIRIPAKTRAPAFLPQVRQLVSFVERIALIRVMFGHLLLTSSTLTPCTAKAASRRIDSAGLNQNPRPSPRAAGNTLLTSRHGRIA